MWRVAKSLDFLLAELNAKAPKRSKASDGSIGDAAHASRTSDHNPWVKDARGVGVVRARDFTHDPQDGLDGGWLAQVVADQLGKHPALGSGAYVIWNRRIISTDRLREGWRPYSGSNAHTKHVHVSVGAKGYDSTAKWLPKPRRRIRRPEVRAALDALRKVRDTAKNAAGRSKAQQSINKVRDDFPGSKQ